MIQMTKISTITTKLKIRMVLSALYSASLLSPDKCSPLTGVTRIFVYNKFSFASPAEAELLQRGRCE